MTDKQIIINDVDVLNCGYFSQFEGKTENACYIQPRKVIGSDVNIGFGSCDSSPNCYYKQLKRKEQECDQLKAENNKLKDLNIRLDNQRETYWKEYQKLKQTLQGIKKLVEKNHCSGYETCKECYNTSTCKNDCINKEILQKCEDVL